MFGDASFSSEAENVPNHISYTIPKKAKRIKRWKWRPWGGHSTYYTYDYMIDGVKVGTRSYKKLDGLFRKSLLTDQQSYYKGKLHGLIVETKASHKTEGYFRLGQRHGITKKWMSDGRLEEISEYKNGQRNGKTEWPILNKVSMYKDGKKNGIEIWKTHGYMGFSFPSIVHAMYVDDKQNGITKIYTKNPYSDTIKEPYLIAEIDYVDGKIHGSYKRYDHTNSLRSNSIYANGECYLLTTYYDNGNVLSVTTFNDTSHHGIQIFWRRDGSVKTATFFIEGKVVSEEEYRQQSSADKQMPKICQSLSRDAVLSRLKWKLPFGQSLTTDRRSQSSPLQ